MSAAVEEKRVDVLLEKRCISLGSHEDNDDAEPSGVHFREDGDNSGTGEALESVAAVEGLVYTLPYVGVQEVLVLERVSKSLSDAIRGDVLLWLQVRVDAPLSTKLTDTGLLKLVERAQGRLQSLSLIQCKKISEEAIERVLATNPLLSKLSIPGCTNISAEGLTRMVTNHNGAAATTRINNMRGGGGGLKQLRIEGLYGLNKAILEELQTCLETEATETTTSTTKSEKQPRNYDNYNNYYRKQDSSVSSVSCDEEEDARAIDVASCPRCEFVRLVYDCTGESCQELLADPLRQCRGCLFCIARCADCGCCIADSQYDTFCGDSLCAACWLLLPKCAECNRPACSYHAKLLDNNGAPNSGPTGDGFQDNSTTTTTNYSRPKHFSFVCSQCSSSIPPFDE